ncbi:TraK domain-containing protein [Rhodoferax antarcticus]|uniref:Putative transfer protein TraK n=1 Tax=Rhodoferax antarcticus ANT.BR TaxID=1111071 RepID=A0A1Q8Y9V3_9BURK|nr:type-F conjugative transfer system secretin TraK [Rhodoferax antarcticus]OLP04660.1 putative transfer protein TraK [Rhodoferax antarcticus ANT.BR]
MKKQFLISFVSLACASAFAQSSDLQTPDGGPVVPVAAAQSSNFVVIPKKGFIVVPSRKEAPAARAELRASVSPGALDLPLPKPLKADAQLLPGLGMMPGTITENKIKSVKVGTDRNERIYVSLTQLNKIATPFANPKAIDVTGASLKAVGQDIFVQPSSDQPITIYLSDGGAGQSIGLTLVPIANLPAQSIVIEPEAGTMKNLPEQTALDDFVPSDYVGRITSHIKQLALGKTPSGFSKSKLPLAIANNSQMAFETQFKYVGSSYDIFSYKLTSISSSPVELSEETFYTPNVRAVAFYPNAMLQRGQTTNVFVISNHTGGSK